MGYWICEARTAEMLCESVNSRIEQGWRPLGGLVVVQSRSTSDWWFYQAMILDEQAPEDLREPDFA